MSSLSDSQQDADSKKQALKSLILMATSLSQTLESSGISQPIRPPFPESCIPELILNFPEDLLLPIKNLQIPNSARQQICQRFRQLFSDLQQQYGSAYRSACLAAARDPSLGADFGALQKVYQTMHSTECIPMVQLRISSVIAQVAKLKHHQSISTHTKQPFNIDFIPILEKYFEYNVYPSASHRTILAQKSAMTPRQIEVWFQNHRNRAKKDGRLMRRLTSDFPLQQALTTAQHNLRFPPHRLPTPFDTEDNSVTKQVVQPTHPSSQQVSFLDDAGASRPPHSFPANRSTQYCDPFPSDGGIFRFPTPEWRRQPASPQKSSIVVDMDEFVQTFHLKLNFSENSRRRGTTPSKREYPQPWFHATTTTPSIAPHPALIRKPDVSRPTPPSLENFTSKPIVFSPSFWRVDTSMAFLPVPPGEAPARKTRPLPRRIPPRSPSSSFGSRTSSFSSDTSSGSSASSSSSSYSSSPELSTPPPLPDRDLPDFHDDAQQQDYLFDFSQTDLDTDYPSASQTFDFSFNDPSLNKIPDLSCFSLQFPDFNNLAQIIS